MRALVLLGALAMLGGCSDPVRDDYPDPPSEEQKADATADVSADLADSTYEGESFAYGCTQDCSGHEAGWEYAAENGFTDPSECGGADSQSFDEGCMAFAEELQSRVEDTEADGY